MKANIIKEDLIELREELLKYGDTAEQYEMPRLLLIYFKLKNSIENFDKISDNDEEKNALFRCAYLTMGKDFCEYKIE